MRHTTDFIADSMFLDKDTARKVALENEDRFGVVMIGDDPSVGTFSDRAIPRGCARAGRCSRGHDAALGAGCGSRGP